MGAPFLAGSLREKWGFSTERSRRVRPGEARAVKISQENRPRHGPRRSDFVTSLSLRLTTLSAEPKIRCITQPNDRATFSPRSGTEPARNNF